MRNKIQQISALGLSVILLFVLVPAVWAEGNKGTEPGGTGTNPISADGSISLPLLGVDFEPGACGVSINLIPADKENTAFATEIVNAKVQADLYLIASAKKDDRYDTYSYDYTESAFSSLSEQINNALAADPEKPNDQDTMLKKFSPVAQEAAKTVRDSADDIPTANSPSPVTAREINVSGLDAGMYLLILRSSDLSRTGENTYFTTMIKEGGGSSKEYGDADTEIIVTTAKAGTYEFFFEPQIITLPTKVDSSADPPTQNYNTAYGEWSYTLNITAKPDWTSFGNLKIIKKYDDSSYAGTKATFCYRITAILDGTVVFDDIREITVPDTDYVMIEKEIPIGATVTVEESYDGSRYVLSGSQIIQSDDSGLEKLIINSSETDPATIEFTNTNDGSPKEGYGILNTFSYNGSEWVWRDPQEGDQEK